MLCAVKVRDANPTQDHEVLVFPMQLMKRYISALEIIEEEELVPIIVSRRNLTFLVSKARSLRLKDKLKNIREKLITEKKGVGDIRRIRTCNGLTL